MPDGEVLSSRRDPRPKRLKRDGAGCKPAPAKNISMPDGEVLSSRRDLRPKRLKRDGAGCKPAPAKNLLRQK
jgi:hypothetical protein